MLYFPNYAGALRCIGQALENQNIEVFELKCHGNEFRLQCGEPNPPFTTLMKMSFSKEQIQMIDREGRARRSQAAGPIRFDTTSEILRAVGAYLDKKGGYLQSINTSGSSSDVAVELEYQTKAGDVEVEVLPMKFIREACIQMYKRRTGLKTPINLVTRKR